jgi:CRISPR-associated endonuclease/helicase Cas3
VSKLAGDRFAEFFEALYEKPPFPWQIRLAEQVITADRAEQAWPEWIALPTASGKTACIDIAVFALACQASNGTRRAPRRVFFVVDRRVIVDQALDHAQKIANRLDQPDSEVLRLVAESLLELSRGPYGEHNPPLACFQLRGGVYRDDAWARSPTQPMVVCGTVDQIGSRLLFRGYGVSDKSRPLHAGLIANDSLIILDEAHCAVPFEQTIQAVRRYRAADWAKCPLESPFSVAVMSATPRNQGTQPFTLRDADYENETLGSRLRASKPARLIEIKAKTATAAFAQSLVQEARRLAEGGARRIAILANRVDTAKLAYQLLNVAEDRKALFIGRMRPLDSQRLMETWKDRLKACEGRSKPEQPIFVAATQCLEVGADFDFDGMVSECASLDALQQRFGRLNRLGKESGEAVIAISAEDAKGKQPDPVYETALAATWNWLNAHATREEAESAAVINMGVEAVREALASTPDEAKSKLFPQTENAPVMLPTHVDCWVQTAPRPETDPVVSLFLHGPSTGAPEVRVCWRADLEFDVENPRSLGDGRQQRWIDVLSLCPPASGECMPVPLYQFRAWMRGEAVDSKLLISKVRMQSR